MSSIRVSVLGLRGHAWQHINMLGKSSDVILEKVYYHRAIPKGYENIPITNNLEDCLESDAVIIATPTNTHFDLLKEMTDYRGYILLEKPAVNTVEQVEELYNFTVDQKQKIKVNFNFKFHRLGSLIRDLKLSGQLGQIFSLDVHTSHGVAFKNDWSNTWRVENKTGLGPMETTGIHYIHFGISEFGECLEGKLYTACLSGRNSATDTAILNMMMADGTHVRIRHSYACPYSVRFELWGADGYLIYDGSTATLYHPRDTFDDAGRFTNPPIDQTWDIDFQEAWIDSLLRSQQSFLRVVKNGELLDPLEFDRDVLCMSVLF